jgi:mRNA-degrading endonuclease RelE of RelBE toxin-antitoxin system
LAKVNGHKAGLYNVERYEVEIAPRAEARMYDHFAFLAQVSPGGAEKLLKALVRDMKSLESNPYAYPYYNRPHAESCKYRYVLSYSRYRIVYQVVTNTVYVDDIQDCRQDDDKNLI